MDSRHTSPTALHHITTEIVSCYLSERNGGTDIRTADIEDIITHIIGGSNPLEVFHALVYLYVHKLQGVT